MWSWNRLFDLSGNDLPLEKELDKILKDVSSERRRKSNNSQTGQVEPPEELLANLGDALALESSVESKRPDSITKSSVPTDLISPNRHPGQTSAVSRPVGDCLDFEEFTQYLQIGDLASARKQHLESCAVCRGLVDVGRAKSDVVQSMAAFLAQPEVAQDGAALLRVRESLRRKQEEDFRLGLKGSGLVETMVPRAPATVAGKSAFVGFWDSRFKPLVSAAVGALSMLFVVENAKDLGFDPSFLSLRNASPNESSSESATDFATNVNVLLSHGQSHQSAPAQSPSFSVRHETPVLISHMENEQAVSSGKESLSLTDAFDPTGVLSARLSEQKLSKDKSYFVVFDPENSKVCLLKKDLLATSLKDLVTLPTDRLTPKADEHSASEASGK